MTDPLSPEEIMELRKSTPGPWKLKGYGSITDQDGDLIATTGYRVRVGDTEDDTNALLIVQAPRLLDIAEAHAKLVAENALLREQACHHGWRGCSLMEATIREQKNVNDGLAFQLGGMKRELRYVRRLLRRIWSRPTSRDDELFAQDVVTYLASLPATEEES